MKKWLVVLVVLGAVGTVAFRQFGDSEPGSTNADNRGRETATAEIRPLELRVSAYGSVVSNLDVEIKCKASGEIIELPYDISDQVNKGDLLVKLDPTDEERSVRRAEVQLSTAESRLAQAKQNLAIAEAQLKISRTEANATLDSALASARDLREKAKRAVTLREKRFASDEEVSSAEAAAIQAESSAERARAGIEALTVDEQRLELERLSIKLADAELESALVNLDDARQRLTETQVYAPLSGVVSSKLVQVGQIISSPTMNVGGGTALLQVSDLSRIFVIALVDESDIGHIDTGQHVDVTVDAFPDRVFDGEVVRVATAGEKTSSVVTFEVKIEVLGAGKQRMRPGMTADIEILAASNDSALCVPSEAVERRGPDRVVLVPGASGAEPQPVPVRIGIDDGVYAEIIEGLEKGDTVFLPDYSPVDDAPRGFGGPPPGGPGPR